MGDNFIAIDNMSFNMAGFQASPIKLNHNVGVKIHALADGMLLNHGDGFGYWIESVTAHGILNGER